CRLCARAVMPTAPSACSVPVIEFPPEETTSPVRQRQLGVAAGRVALALPCQSNEASLPGASNVSGVLAFVNAPDERERAEFAGNRTHPFPAGILRRMRKIRHATSRGARK